MEGQRAPLGEIYYRGRSGWTPLPEWGRFMLEVGARVVDSRPAEGRVVIALSLPVRAFAAALSSASAVITAFRDRPPLRDVTEHFDYLASLPEGTAISHHRANSVQQGRLVGVETSPYDAAPAVRIKLRKEERLLPVGLCTEIQVIDEPGTLKVRKQTLVKDPSFLAHALPGADIASLSANTRLDCVIVAVQHSLEEELLARQFGAAEEDRIHEGTLQGIVRARQLAGSKDAYRSAIIPAHSEEPAAALGASAPRIAIFDGASAFNNWRSRLPQSNWLVLLDRGSRSAEQGAAAINQAYAMRLDDSDALKSLDVPAGIETLAYVERR